MFAWFRTRRNRRCTINEYLVAADRKCPSRLDAADAQCLEHVLDDEGLMADWGPETLERLAGMAPDLDTMTPEQVDRLLDRLADELWPGDERG